VSRSLSEADVAALGERLGRSLPSGSIVWLEGALGAGKTTLVRAVLRARGAHRPATSPTFNLVHRHEGPRGPVFHVDCYRLRHPTEASELDWGELIGSDLLLIEWPDRAGEWAPAPDLRIRLAHTPDPDRRAIDLDPPVSEAG
jgi:tRNA threonylcarbamoyladenosine biosynthesis protein TsaE